MDQFTVPKFIEHEAKIVGPLTFKQFIFIGIAGAICFILYFTLPFSLFLLCSIIIILIGIALAFLKAGGRSLPIVLKNFFTFFLSPKIYLWRKKGSLPPKIIDKEKLTPKETKEVPVPTIVGKSRLKDLSTQVETKIKDETE